MRSVYSRAPVSTIYNPSSRHIDLLAARKAIDEALSVMNATKWPTNADYDLAENA
ncbi:hypothetical protein [Ensifer sp. BR816]|uniref:hypothetical protein n=1 Tax=Rhizobium sp. (strain BR816) TaxID=1057002 RepID=UPI000360982F|nr:hypothetical protein [Ensifer sp. BR816]